MEEYYSKAHAAIRADPSPKPKKELPATYKPKRYAFQYCVFVLKYCYARPVHAQCVYHLGCFVLAWFMCTFSVVAFSLLQVTHKYLSYFFFCSYARARLSRAQRQGKVAQKKTAYLHKQQSD